MSFTIVIMILMGGFLIEIFADNSDDNNRNNNNNNSNKEAITVTEKNNNNNTKMRGCSDTIVTLNKRRSIIRMISIFEHDECPEEKKNP